MKSHVAAWEWDAGAIDRIREAAAHLLRANVTDALLWTTKDEIFALVHRRRGIENTTRCGRSTHAGSVPLGVTVDAEHAVQQLMCPCPACGFEEHR